MMLLSKMLAPLLIAGAVAAPTVAQVTTPPATRPAPTPSYKPADPNRQRVATPPTNRDALPDMSYQPITVRDNDGELVPITDPVEYVAMSHNPMLDLPTMVKVAPFFYPRRVQVERLVIEHLETMIEIENGLLDSMRIGDEEAMRSISGKLAAFTANTGVLPYISTEITNADVVPRQVGILTQRILSKYQNDLTMDTMAQPTTEDGATGTDQMMQKVMRMSITEHEYYYRRLMMDAADQLDAVLPRLALDAQTAAAVAPLASKLRDEGDLDARAALIRAIFAELGADTRRQALELTVELRPEVDATALMAPVPEGATPKKLDDETRMEMIYQLIEGGRVDTAKFVER